MELFESFNETSSSKNNPDPQKKKKLFMNIKNQIRP